MIQKITKASVRITFACAIALASSGAALAHAALHHASPEAGSTVSESPHEVTLTFTDTLEAAFSSADVTNSSGAGKPPLVRVTPASPAMMEVPRDEHGLIADKVADKVKVQIANETEAAPGNVDRE